MTASRAWTWALTTSGILQVGVAIAHFGLQYEWRGVDGGSLPQQLRWALFALNFSWAVLVLGVGALIVYVARVDPYAALVRPMVFVVGLFWFIHGIYVAVIPMPVPDRLSWIQGPIVAFPATVVALQWLSLSATKIKAAAVVGFQRPGANRPS